MSVIRTVAKRTRIADHGVQVVAAVGLLTYLVATTATFRGTAAAFSVVEGAVLIGLVALGIAVTMIAGELDLSVASMAALGGVVAIYSAPLGLVGALVAATAACTVLGFIQGAAIARLGINSLVLTIATSIALRGFVWIVSNEAPVQLDDFTVSDQLLASWWIFSLTSAVAIAVFIAVALFLGRLRLGRTIYAVGGARTEAAAAGVNVSRAITVAFATSASCAGLAGALVSLRAASAAPNAFPSLLLLAVAACLIGGVSLSGGQGSVTSVLLGVLVVSSVNVGLAAKGSPAYMADLVIGVVLVVVVLLNLGQRMVASPRRRKCPSAAAQQSPVPVP